VERL
jgi:hypothetical protein